MRCPFCAAIEDKVVDTRPSDNDQVIRRRRECVELRPALHHLRARRRDPAPGRQEGRSARAVRPREDPDGLKRACSKRPVPVEVLERAADRIERELEDGRKGDAVVAHRRRGDGGAARHRRRRVRPLRVGLPIVPRRQRAHGRAQEPGRRQSAGGASAGEAPAQTPAGKFSAADVAVHAARAGAGAARRAGTTRPNPMVGAVVVRAGRIVAEGFHRRAGAPHAEVNALAGLAAGAARGATLYVTLEPCGHTGRTGPCTEALLAARGGARGGRLRDPNPLVDGRGIARLRRAGMRVDVGCLEAESRGLNRAFAIWVREQRPLVTLKAAATLDGFIADGRARAGGARRPGSRARRRGGPRTSCARRTTPCWWARAPCRADDPRLTVRLPTRRRRPRAACSTAAASLAGARVLAGGAPGPRLHEARRRRRRARARCAPRARGHRLRARGRVPSRVLRALAAREIQSVLVEGGAAVARRVHRSRAGRRVALFVAPQLLGGGVGARPRASAARSPRALRARPHRAAPSGGDMLLTGRRRPRQP